MKYFFLLFILASCQDYNSNSGDRAKFGPVVLDETDPNFRRAYFIIQDRCVSCHDHRHDKWADFKSNDEWESEGLVVPGQPATSEFIERIVNTGQVSSNMPPGGSPLPDAEYAHLVKWVTEFQ
ncbi:MAG: cytochrome c [Bdellovibrionales bacterium]|nr:cytochrome c [Bdellovibrionales bacterium]